MALPELQPINPFTSFLQGKQLRQQEALGEQQNALSQLQLSEAQRKSDETQGLNRLYQMANTPEGGIDYSKLLPGAAKAGYGSAIPGLVKQRSEQQTAERAADKARLESTLGRFDFVGRVMSGVKQNPASYPEAVALIEQEYPEMAGKLPPTYDPAAVDAGQLRAMSVKDQLEQEWKQKGYDLDKGQYDPSRGVMVDPLKGTARPVTLADGGALPAKTPTERPLPATIMKQATDSREALRAAESMSANIQKMRQLVQGEAAPGTAPAGVQTDPLSRAGAAVRQFTGAGSENSRGLLELKRFKEKLRGDYLLLSKGVQTEGDAKRAMDAMMPDTNDPKAILMQLDSVQAAQEQLQALHDESLSVVEQEYGKNLRIGQPAGPNQRTVVRTGTHNGRKVVQYSDGTIEEAQ
jgi:hypothetical protein